MKPNHSSPPSISSSLNFQDSETRNWLDLPRDITATILLKLGPIEILNNAQRVCTLWRSISKDPLMWRVIDMTYSFSFDPSCIEKMCRHAIDRSQGNLVAITLCYVASDDLLHYIADSTSHLQRLRLLSCWDISEEGMSEVAKKLPLLEDLDITIGNLSKDALEAIGQCCPLLKSLKFNMQAYKDPNFVFDEEAFAIAKHMPKLCHLQLFGNKLSDDGVLAILDGCPRLESLDLRRCFNVNLGGSLKKRCAEQIRDFRHPNDPTDDYGFDGGSDYDDDSFGYDEYFDYEDYPSGILDMLSTDDEYDYYGFSYGSDYEAYFGL
ncbi:hypothetical protein RIF29_42228 [Crotalaria pallida]|uniref:F-box domain-containing protein n=1 Tax=Crotalaria pallida TaxID=3830 RepID=A0AAN9E8R8_CROPI